MVPVQMGPGFTSTSPALRRSSQICRAGWAAPAVEKGGCATPIAQAGCVGPDSRICVRRLHLLTGHHVKVPDHCLRLHQPLSTTVHILCCLTSVFGRITLLFSLLFGVLTKKYC